MKKNVLVTGIGGNVGQGILRNIISSGFDINVTGTNISQVSAGNHLCDKVYLLPYAYEDNYIKELIKVCEKEKIDLIIPSTDWECLILSQNTQSLPKVATSSYETNLVFFDKYLTYQHFKKHNIPFANSFLPSEYKNTFKKCIAKPKSGRGSRGIFLNPSSVTQFTDEEYMIQELIEGIEITTAFYIDAKGKLLGHITFDRELAQGTTALCKVNNDYNKPLEEMIRAISSSLNINGSCNIQSIVNGKGEIIPFEINGRISGTNSIRSNFGFKDVKYVLQEYLYEIEAETPVLTDGVAIRVLMDVIYPGAKSYDDIKDKHTKHYIF